MTEYLKDIQKTIGDYEVKNLKWNKVDNIIVGFVRCPITGRDNLHNGFVCVTWTKRGMPLKHFKGREDLQIIINY